jgi:hypothetical protein
VQRWETLILYKSEGTLWGQTALYRGGHWSNLPTWLFQDLSEVLPSAANEVLINVKFAPKLCEDCIVIRITHGPANCSNFLLWVAFMLVEGSTWEILVEHQWWSLLRYKKPYQMDTAEELTHSIKKRNPQNTALNRTPAKHRLETQVTQPAYNSHRFTVNLGSVGNLWNVISI